MNRFVKIVASASHKAATMNYGTVIMPDSDDDNLRLVRLWSG